MARLLSWPLFEYWGSFPSHLVLLLPPHCSACLCWSLSVIVLGARTSETKCRRCWNHFRAKDRMRAAVLNTEKQPSITRFITNPHLCCWPLPRGWALCPSTSAPTRPGGTWRPRRSVAGNLLILEKLSLQVNIIFPVFVSHVSLYCFMFTAAQE